VCEWHRDEKKRERQPQPRPTHITIIARHYRAPSLAAKGF
jgi:hypothetical protein